MKTVWAVMENVPYEGNFLWAIYTTKKRAKRELEKFLTVSHRKRDRKHFEVEERKLDQPQLEFKKGDL